MNDEPPLGQDVPISNKLHFVRKLYDFLISKFDCFFSIDSSNVVDFELSLRAVYQRTCSYVAGFALLMDNKLCLYAAPLIRQQIDNMLYLTAASLVDDPDTLVIQLKEGTELKKIRTSTSLPDNFKNKLLLDRLIIDYSKHGGLDLSRNYDIASKYIHFSYKHIEAVAIKNDAEILQLGHSCADMVYTDNDTKDMIDAFIETTENVIYIFDYCLQSYRLGRNRPWQLLNDDEDTHIQLG
jgi:hypothetical protein